MATKKTSKKKLLSSKAKPAKKAILKAKAPKKAIKAPQLKKITLSSIKKPLTKSQAIEHIANTTGVRKKDVSNIFEAIVGLLEAHLGKKGPGEMNFAGILKCRVIHKPATKARQGTNPFTGEPMTFAAKPARNVIKVRALKRLKEAVN